MPEQFLTPFVATIIFVIACIAGYGYRRVWKAEGARWKLWVYGVIAAAALLVLAFIPLSTPG
ncbi:hypothetical protein [uncultured Maritimibacter sp.]|uniref:hypothetical protein n=1 Tax=uncultured Maritimibacter sp. TaxID=991866 RepID=UPI002597BDF5|nr:hypothetical protein [uncultured Maritimibacter sp.]